MLAAAPAIRSVTLTEQVVVNIHSRILSGALAPGERLVEQTLARDLGVGQNVVREALISLAHRGFVKRITNRGTYVTELTFPDAVKLAQVRQKLESLVCELILHRMQTEVLDFEPSLAALRIMSDAAKQGDRNGYYEADLRFHQALWELAGNEYLSASLEQIVVPLFAFYLVLYGRHGSGSNTLPEAVAAHQDLVQQLRSGDVSSLAAIRNIVQLSLEHHQDVISAQ